MEEQIKNEEAVSQSVPEVEKVDENIENREPETREEAMVQLKYFNEKYSNIHAERQRIINEENKAEIDGIICNHGCKTILEVFGFSEVRARMTGLVTSIVLADENLKDSGQEAEHLYKNLTKVELALQFVSIQHKMRMKNNLDKLVALAAKLGDGKH